MAMTLLHHWNQADWLVDSSATNHMTDDKSIFTKIWPVNGPKITTAGQGVLQATGKGDISIVAANGVDVAIKDVLLVPELGHNLLSLVQLEDCRIGYRSANSCMEFTQQGKAIGYTSR